MTSFEKKTKQPANMEKNKPKAQNKIPFGFFLKNEICSNNMPTHGFMAASQLIN